VSLAWAEAVPAASARTARASRFFFIRKSPVDDVEKG
jgi:hypothetical protein